MRIKFEDINLNVIADKNRNRPDSIPIVFLHGFGGRAEDWLFLFDKLYDKLFPVSIDLIGHGESSCPSLTSKYSTESLINQIETVREFLNINKLILAGYSMGGRAALGYTISHPENVKALILESASPGITDQKEREERRQSDELLALKIETEGIIRFMDFWMNQPLFGSLKKLPPQNFSDILNEKYKNNPVGLAGMLRGFSPGIMPDYWPELFGVRQKTLLISGELDTKYTSICKEMSEIIPNSSHEIISDCGHNTHLEKPEQFIKLIMDFLNKCCFTNITGI